LTNSSKYNHCIHYFYLHFSNRYCLHRNDCPPGVAVVDSK